MKNLIIISLAFLFLFILPIQAEVKVMDEKLPQPDDPVLFSVTEKNITMDIVSLDLVTFPVSEYSGISTDQGTYDYFLVGICFTAIDDGEWMVIPANSSVGKIEIMARTYANGGMITATTEKQGRICGQLGYDVTGMKLDWSQPLSIRIRSLFAPAREGSPCKDIMRRYETNAAARAMKVSLSCDDNISDEWIRGPKNYILRVVDWDRERMSQEEAQTKVEEFLDFDIDGHWTITIENPMDHIVDSGE